MEQHNNIEQFINGNSTQTVVVDRQSEGNNREVTTGTEAEQLLKKYYADVARQQAERGENPFTPQANEIPNDDGFRGFAGIEEPVVKPHDPRRDADKHGEYHNTVWGSEDGFDMEITVTSTMPLPKR